MNVSGIKPKWEIDLMNSSALNFKGSQGNGTQPREIWFNNPHGAPSGVWTGHTNPHDSGNNFLTVVVFYSAKYWPLWRDLKWERYLIWLSLSATIVYPLVYIISRFVLEVKFPVARKLSILLHTNPPLSTFFLR